MTSGNIYYKQGKMTYDLIPYFEGTICNQWGHNFTIHTDNDHICGQCQMSYNFLLANKISDPEEKKQKLEYQANLDANQFKVD